MRLVNRKLAAVGALVAAFGFGWVSRAYLAGGRERPPGEVPPIPEWQRQPQATASPSMEAVFGGIYQHASWGKNSEDAGGSGFGSSLRATLLYRTFLEQFMKDAEVHSVVDAGCGDWEFSQAIDWNGIDYKGFDIVKSVIERDRQRHGKPNIQFLAANIIEEDLPPADLLISKHVLQHLPTADVQRFLKQLPKYKHVLLVSSVNAGTLSGKNDDIPSAGFASST
ncbi:hypothetical protein BH11MYX4_BH11MYX4_28200 [soil metagenome]